MSEKFAQGNNQGNSWWQLRATSGRKKTFESPEQLWISCQEYFKATEKRKWLRTDFKGKEVQEDLIPTDTPFTLTGRYIFLEIDENTWQRYRKEDPYKEFWAVVKIVDQIIYNQKFEGAAVGVYNSNIIARDLGLIDKKQTEQTGRPTIMFERVINKPNESGSENTD